MPRRVAAIGVLILLVGCGPSTTGSTTTAPATTTSSAPSTTVTTLPPASTTLTTPSLFPPLDFECPPVLVVGDGLTAIDADCSVTHLGYDEPVSDESFVSVMDDMAGGLFYQSDGSAIFWLGAGADRLVPLVAVDDPEAESVFIEDVVLIDGEVELWFSRGEGLDWEDAEDIPRVVQTLERVGVDAGEPTEVAQIGSWESGSSVTVGGETVGIENWAEGFYYFAVTDFEMERLPQPWNFYNPDEPKDVGCEGCPTSLVVSDDGSRAVFLEPLVLEAITLPVLVVVDLVSGEAVARVEVSGFGWPLNAPAEGPEITTVDVLGDLVLVNGADEGQPFPAIWTDLGAAEPVWEALPVPGSGRFLRSDVRLAELKATDLPWSTG